MRVLFSLRHPGYLRNYEPVVRLLAEHGHQVHLVFHTRGAEDADESALVGAVTGERVSSTATPMRKRTDHWRALSSVLRGAQDYLRYRAPEYHHADRLRDRAYGKLRRPLQVTLSAWARIGGARGCRLLARALRAAELAVPPDARLLAFLRSLHPDVMLVTPLVDLLSPQKDYLRAAQAAGCPVVLCVASWDNLTNKGLIGPAPDLVLLWNERQREEAVRLHGIAPERVRITGAQCYDHWFARQPSSTRERFCATVGLDPRRRFVLFLCSSPFVAGDEELGLVRRWAAAIRGSSDPRLAGLGILVRPHPQHAAVWDEAADLTALGDVAVHPRGGANPVDEPRRAELFDSLFHCAAVVGINTSAMIEAAIVGRPVLTVTLPEVAATQTGTLHFHHLVKGGLLHASATLEEHIGQLAMAITSGLETSGRDAFVRSFVRPLGLDRPATPQVVAAIEELASRAAAPETVRGAALLRRMLLPAALLLTWVDHRQRTLTREVTAFTRRAARSVLRRAGLRRREETERERQAAAGPQRPKQIRLAVRRLAVARSPIVIGPWLSEVGFEVLYWIPFLNWACEYAGLDPERLVVVGRGGSGAWYGDLAARRLDVLDFFTVDEFRAANERRIALTGGQKHRRQTDLDAEILRRVSAALGVPAVEVLHPSLMYNLFVRFWRAKAGLELIEHYSRFRRFPPPADVSGLELPEGDYVAVKFYWSNCFPATLENQALVARILRTLTAQIDVVLLDTGLQLDDHRDCEPGGGDRVHRIAGRVVPARNLELQSRVVAGARAFVGTYGGFSYLAPSYGVPALAVYSDPAGFLPVHLQVAEHAFAGPPFGPFRIAEAAEVGDVSWLWTENGLRAAVV